MNLTKSRARLFVCSIIFRKKKCKKNRQFFYDHILLCDYKCSSAARALWCSWACYSLYRMECYIRAALSCGQHFTLSFFFVCLFIFFFCLSVQSISTLRNVRNNSVTSQYGALDISLSGSVEIASHAGVFWGARFSCGEG